MATPEGPAIVSTLREAEYFAEGGVRDMIYGVGIAPAKLARVSAVRSRGVDLAVILDSLEQADAVAAHIRSSGDALPVLIEVDPRRPPCRRRTEGRGGARGDRPASRPRAVPSCEASCSTPGRVTALSDPASLAAAAEAERVAAVTAAETLRRAGLPCPMVSVGSTPTARFARDLTGVTEVRAGVFMFGDLVQAGIGRWRWRISPCRSSPR